MSLTLELCKRIQSDALAEAKDIISQMETAATERAKTAATVKQAIDAFNRFPNVVKMALPPGLDLVPKEDTLIGHVSEHGEFLDKTPLAYAALLGKTDFIELILKAGDAKNLFTKDHIHVAIFYAAREGHMDALKRLLEHPKAEDIAFSSMIPWRSVPDSVLSYKDPGGREYKGSAAPTCKALVEKYVLARSQGITPSKTPLEYAIFMQDPAALAKAVAANPQLTAAILNAERVWPREGAVPKNQSMLSFLVETASLEFFDRVIQIFSQRGQGLQVIDPKILEEALYAAIYHPTNSAQFIKCLLEFPQVDAIDLTQFKFLGKDLIGTSSSGACLIQDYYFRKKYQFNDLEIAVKNMDSIAVANLLAGKSEAKRGDAAAKEAKTLDVKTQLQAALVFKRWPVYREDWAKDDNGERNALCFAIQHSPDIAKVLFKAMLDASLITPENLHVFLMGAAWGNESSLVKKFLKDKKNLDQIDFTKELKGPWGTKSILAFENEVNGIKQKAALLVKKFWYRKKLPDFSRHVYDCDKSGRTLLETKEFKAATPEDIRTVSRWPNEIDLSPLTYLMSNGLDQESAEIFKRVADKLDAKEFTHCLTLALEQQLSTKQPTRHITLELMKAHRHMDQAVAVLVPPVNTRANAPFRENPEIRDYQNRKLFMDKNQSTTLQWYVFKDQAADIKSMHSQSPITPEEMTKVYTWPAGHRFSSLHYAVVRERVGVLNELLIAGQGKIPQVHLTKALRYAVEQNPNNPCIAPLIEALKAITYTLDLPDDEGHKPSKFLTEASLKLFQAACAEQQKPVQREIENLAKLIEARKNIILGKSPEDPEQKYRQEHLFGNTPNTERVAEPRPAQNAQEQEMQPLPSAKDREARRILAGTELGKFWQYYQEIVQRGGMKPTLLGGKEEKGEKEARRYIALTEVFKSLWLNGNVKLVLEALRQIFEKEGSAGDDAESIITNLAKLSVDELQKQAKNLREYLVQHHPGICPEIMKLWEVDITKLAVGPMNPALQALGAPAEQKDAKRAAGTAPGPGPVPLAAALAPKPERAPAAVLAPKPEQAPAAAQVPAAPTTPPEPAQQQPLAGPKQIP